MKLCPYKFGYYEFEGGQDCIGSECGMFKRCNADDEITAVEFDALDEHAQALERENAELKAKLDQMTVERDILQDCVDDLNADTSELQAKLAEYESKSEICTILSGGKIYTGSKALTERIAELQARVDELKRKLEIADRHEVESDQACDECKEHTDELIAELRKQVDELTEQRDRWRSNWTGRNMAYSELADDYQELEAKVDELTAELERETLMACNTCAARIDLKQQVDELTEQLESAYAKNRSLRAHIAKMQDGRHGWHVKGVELQKQVDGLTAENAKLSSDELHLRNALAQSEHELATLRDKLGRMLDNAHEITRIGGDC